jgi:hypothetical protein
MQVPRAQRLSAVLSTEKIRDMDASTACTETKLPPHARPRTDGWTLERVKGSHHQFVHPTKPGAVTVVHPTSRSGRSRASSGSLVSSFGSRRNHGIPSKTHKRRVKLVGRYGQRENAVERSRNIARAAVACVLQIGRFHIHSHPEEQTPP